MWLKDEIIEQKRKESEQAKIAAELQQRENVQKFTALKENYSKGIVPSEWEEIYDKYAAKIREWFSNNSDDFICKDSITEEYFRSKADNGDGSTSELTLMNEYLTKRLQSDGFNGAQFKLVEETETYATDEDWARYRAESEEDKRRIMDNYREALWNEFSKDAGMGDANNVAAPRISTVSLCSTGTRQVYYIVVKCYLEDDDEDANDTTAQTAGKSSNAPSTKSGNAWWNEKDIRWRKKQVLTCAGICAGIGLVAAIILVFTASILEMFIPIFAVMGFVYGLLLGLAIRSITFAIYTHRQILHYKSIHNKSFMRDYIFLAIFFFAVLIAAIVGGIIGILKFI